MRKNTNDYVKNSNKLNFQIRRQVLKILEEYEKTSQSLRSILRENFLSSSYSRSSWSAIEALCTGVIRHLNTIDFLINRGLRLRKIKNIRMSERIFLRLVIYETRWLRQPIETIQKEYPKMSPNILSIIKNAISIDLEKLIESKPKVNRYSLQYSHPTFFIDTIMQNMTDNDTLNLLQVNNSTHSFYVRPNNLLSGSDEFKEILQQLGVGIKPDPDYPWLFQVLKGIDRLIASEHFNKGRILIQEKGSIVTIEALNPKPGEMIWDACAAPGQKTQLICEAMKQQGHVIASDIYPDRLKTAKQRISNLGCKIVECVLTDASRSPVENVDRVLIDAPCSSTGMFQSHPSYKWRLNKESLFAFMSVQNKILDGILGKYKNPTDTEFVYATCSVLPHEGESQIDSIMQRHKIELLDIPGPGTTGYPGFNCSAKVHRLFPHLHKCGGFFIARFKLTN